MVEAQFEGEGQKYLRRNRSPENMATVPRRWAGVYLPAKNSVRP